MGIRVTMLTFNELKINARFIVVEVGIPRITTSARIWVKHDDESAKLLRGKNNLPSSVDSDTIVVEVG